MSRERRDRDLLRDILEAVERLRAYTANLSYDRFLVDTKTQDGSFAT